MPIPTPTVSVVIPCLNEVGTVADCVAEARLALQSEGIDGEVVVADNGSTDGSQAKAATAGARVITVPTRGYGAALIGGIAAARGRYVVMADADCSYDFSELGGFIAALESGADLVMGCRLGSGGGQVLPGAMPLLHRYLGTPVLTWVAWLLFRVPIHDINCGMRGFRRDRMLGLGLHTTGMEFASEMIIKAALNGLRITETPVTLRPDRRGRRPHLRTWRDGWRHLSFMLVHSPMWLFFLPGVGLSLVAVLMLALLFPGPLMVGTVGLDRNTFVIACMALMAGVQLMATGVAARTCALTLELLPATSRSAAMVSSVQLEHGCLVGLAFVLAGIATILRVFSRWEAVLFATLGGAIETRLTVFGSTLILIGIQIASMSFFIAMLRLVPMAAKR